MQDSRGGAPAGMGVATLLPSAQGGDGGGLAHLVAPGLGEVSLLRMLPKATLCAQIPAPPRGRWMHRAIRCEGLCAGERSLQPQERQREREGVDITALKMNQEQGGGWMNSSRWEQTETFENDVIDTYLMTRKGSHDPCWVIKHVTELPDQNIFSMSLGHPHACVGEGV